MLSIDEKSEVSEYRCSSAVFVFEENAEFQVEVGENEGGSPPVSCHDPLVETSGINQSKKHRFCTRCRGEGAEL